MARRHYNMLVTQGERLKRDLVFRDAGVLRNMSTWSGVLVVRNAADGTEIARDPVTIGGASSATVTFDFAPEATTLWPTTYGLQGHPYELWLEEAGGEPHMELEGFISVEESIR